eukprot:7230982-Prymnesium_polylepis.2
MGGYAAARCGIALRASTVIVLAPQVFTCARQRALLGLVWQIFDPELERLTRVAACAGVAMPSLIEVARAEAARAASASRQPRPTDSTTTLIEMHVGARAAGDVQEAMLLKVALDGDAMSTAGGATTQDGMSHSGERVSESASTPSISVEVHVTHGVGHMIATGLKQKERLEEILRAHL